MKTNLHQLNIVGLRELRENMDIYVDRIGKGESFLVLRKSKPVFKIEPIDKWGDAGNWDDVDLRDIEEKGIKLKEFIELVKKSITEDEQNSEILGKTKSERKRPRT